MSRKIFSLNALVLSLSVLTPCAIAQTDVKPVNCLENCVSPMQKPVIYQMMTRLFGNDNLTNKAWGSVSENGVGKFADIDSTALNEIKKLGVTHVWFTGVLHHASMTNYEGFGIGADDPDVVKGRAGSPYAIRDYYNVNPDLAVNPAERLAEFKALVARTHAAGLKVIIDIVPNHVARRYDGSTAPTGSKPFGTNDNTNVTYQVNNNFYYQLGNSFSVPKGEHGNTIPPAEFAVGLDGKFSEAPTKWTGNWSPTEGATKNASIDDWFETVKLNFGVTPNGEQLFPSVPSALLNKPNHEQVAFWQQHELPSTWYEFKRITDFWLSLGVDGFRYDMAEMVPVSFWHFLNSSIKLKNPNALLVAEVYQPALYRDYIHVGKMDLLYDKVGLYDTIKAVYKQDQHANAIMQQQAEISDIAGNMINFMENHDELRMASDAFFGDAKKGRAAFVVSHLINGSPTMLYFAQEFGESASFDSGFGKKGRTSIFDYVSVPSIVKWRNGGTYDGAALAPIERETYEFYRQVMALSSIESVVYGDVHEIALMPKAPHVLAFKRQYKNQSLMVFANLSNQKMTSSTVTSILPTASSKVLLGNESALQINAGKLNITLEPYQYLVVELGE